MDIPYQSEKILNRWIFSDKNKKKLKAEAFLKLMLFAQLCETEGLLAINDALLDDYFQKNIVFIPLMLRSYHVEIMN